MNSATAAPGMAILTALLLVGTVTRASARDPHPVHYTCADGTQLQATSSPPSISTGSVKLIFQGSSAEATLLQTVSADGGRYAQGDVEFWIKGKAATLTRVGKHLIGSDPEPERSRPFSTHVALTTSNFEAALARLEQHGATYVSLARQPKDITIRPDGVRQIYFQDPDGHWIEINDANAEP